MITSFRSAARSQSTALTVCNTESHVVILLAKYNRDSHDPDDFTTKNMALLLSHNNAKVNYFSTRATSLARIEKYESPITGEINL